jgi:UDP-2,4-diacetamido-2,4,6-trideoxy-beta-L-altropyranose hydrolase
VKVVFRTDSSSSIGMGHVSRCLALAEQLSSGSAECRFLCRDLPGNYISMLIAADMQVTVLPRARKTGVNAEADADSCIEALEGDKPDLIVVDHYGLDEVWEERLRPHTSRLMAIDDTANRRHNCDVLIDQNFVPNPGERYRNLVPKECRMLLGPRYALLKPDYRQARESAGERRARVERIFVFFGGSDPDDLTGTTLGALCSREFGDLSVDIVIGANYAHAENLRRIAARRPKTTVHCARRHLADLMASADLAVGAGGVTTWERMCLGLPSAVVCVADNQRPSCAALSDSGLIYYVGAAGDVTAADLSAAIGAAIGSGARLFRNSERCQLLVDGFGAARVAEHVDPTPAQDLTLRPARMADMGLYFTWVNDTQVRMSSLNTAEVSWREHVRWFRRKLSDVASRLFVMEARGLPVAQIRFDFEGDQATIDYSVDRDFRGRGWGKPLVMSGIERCSDRQGIVFRAQVKADNLASVAIFRRIGFDLAATGSTTDLMEFRLRSASGIRPGFG